MNAEEEIRDLKERLEEQDGNCRQAAEIGKALLEENIQLKSNMDDIVKQYSKKVETLQQDNYSLSLKVEAHAKEKLWFDEEMSQLKTDLQTQKQSLSEQFEIDKNQDSLYYKKQMNELKLDYEQAQAIEKQLKEKIEQLEELLQQQLNQTQISSKSFYGDELNEMQQELMKLQADNTNLTAQMIDTHMELKCSQETCSSLKTKLCSKDEEIQEIQCHMTSYCNNVEKLKTENADLSAQLEALRMETNSHNKKGNSIFSELEDRRVEAEKRLISLRVKNETLKEKFEIEKQLHQKLKMQMVMLLKMSTGRSDSSTVTRLQTQLTEARSTIKELLEKLEKYENSENIQLPSITDIENKVDEEDKKYVQYLITMLKTKESEVNRVNNEHRYKNLQLLDVSNKLLTQEKSVVELQQKNDVLRSQNIKLALKNEELQLKYEPDQIQDQDSKQVLQRQKEKIPLSEISTDTPEPQIIEKNNTSISDSSYLQIATRLNIPRKKVPLSFRKTVSISNDVDIVSPDGKVERSSLSDDKEEAVKLEIKGAARPKKEQKVKQVKVEPENIHECKQQ
ncbi:hypothetical protein SNE40_014592 [Patella caerulea]|uniref:Uncharacterized protein n=1 Tax=Patella caerulea TaxID=87958 RepID=A0AAN8PTK5_PATCE